MPSVRLIKITFAEMRDKRLIAWLHVWIAMNCHVRRLFAWELLGEIGRLEISPMIRVLGAADQPLNQKWRGPQRVMQVGARRLAFPFRSPSFGGLPQSERRRRDSASLLQGQVQEI